MIRMSWIVRTGLAGTELFPRNEVKMHQLAYTSRDRLAFIMVFLVTAVLLAMYFYFRT